MIDHNDPRLTAFVLGELNDKERALIEKAIGSSPELFQVVEEIRQTTGWLTDEFTAEPPVGLSEQQKSELSSGEVIKPNVAPADSAAAFAMKYWAWGAAAACLLAIAIPASRSIMMKDQNVAVYNAAAKDERSVDGLAMRGESAITQKYESMGSVAADAAGAPSPESDYWWTDDGGAHSADALNSVAETHPTETTYDFRVSTDSPQPASLGAPSVDPDELVRINEVKQRFVDSGVDAFDATEDYIRTQVDFTDEAPVTELSLSRGANNLGDRGMNRGGMMGGMGGGMMGGPGGGLSSMSAGDSYVTGASVPSEGNQRYFWREAHQVELADRVAGTEAVRQLILRENLAEQRNFSLLMQDEELKRRYEGDHPARKPPGTASAQYRQLSAGQTASTRIPPGDQLFSLKIDQKNPDFGRVAQGDVVDVSVAMNEAQGVAKGKQRILSNLAVLDVAAVEATDQTNNEQKIISFRVEPEQAEKLLLAQQLGRLEVAKASETKLAKPAPKPKTWRRVKAIPNASRLMVGDKQELQLNGMDVHVQVDGFRARVLVDYFYYNDQNQQLEGKFKIRLPNDASLYYFAFGQSAFDLTSNGRLPTDEFIVPERETTTRFVSLNAKTIREQRQDVWRNVKEARMVPKEKAAFAYSQTVRRRVDPALVEWSGAGVFNANVFPLMPKKLHRIVVGYDVNLTETENGLAYNFDLPEQLGQCKIEVNVTPTDGSTTTLTAASSTVTKSGNRFVIKEAKPADSIQLAIASPGKTLLRSRDKKAGDFFATRIELDLPSEDSAGSSRAVFLVDTSLSSRPDKFNVWLDLLRATLDNNRDSLKEFTVVFFNVENHFWRDRYTKNTPENVRQLVIDCQQLVLEGATDLYSAVDVVSKTEWLAESSRPDLFLLSDGAMNWGESNLRLIGQVLEQEQLGSLFAYQTGMSGTAVSNLRFLANQTGGAVFSVANEDEVAKASTAHRARPWKLKSIDFDGAADVLTAGRVKWIYPGQRLTVVGRLENNADPSDLNFVVERGDEERTITVQTNEVVESDLASRLYGQVAVGQLESLGESVFDISAAYARHFRITGRTCSLLMLETEADYQRFNIVPQEDLFVIKTKDAEQHIAAVLSDREAELADPKAQLLSWLKRLQSMPGVEFQLATALKTALDDVEVDAIATTLRCEQNAIEDLPKQYIDVLSAERLDYDAVMKESNRRAKTSTDDAIKAMSSLIEQNQGDLVLARDVAFSAMEMSRPSSAYHLLRRVANARPYDPSIYTAIGQCLAQLNKADMAVVYYEIAMSGLFQNQSADYRKIAATEYSYLLREIVAGRKPSNIRRFAEARLETLEKFGVPQSADLLVTMMWNTDQTDVDLHVVEPSGEECFYSHPKTRSGAVLTQDIRNGFGPEMYHVRKAPAGNYDIYAKYFNANANRTGMRSKVYLTIYRDFGDGGESVIRKVVTITNPGQKELVEKLIVK